VIMGKILNRKKIWLPSSLLLITALLAVHQGCSRSFESNEAEVLSVKDPGSQGVGRPNIVFILTDDQDLPSLSQMPNVKALLTDQGLTFNKHYVSLSLCCPSRVAGLRGQFAHNNGIFGNSPPTGGFMGTYSKGLENSTLATWLQDSGYRTVLFGKYLNGYPDIASPNYVPPGWTEWYSPNGGDPYYEFSYSLNEYNSSVDTQPTTVAYGISEQDYMTDVISRKATDFIRRSAQNYSDKPFFAYIAPYAPHSPATPAPRHANTFPGLKAPRPESFNEPDISDKPQWVQVLPLLTKNEVKYIDTLYRHRIQSLLAVDEMVKAVVDTLAETGQLENTYIFFASDNGYHQGQHRLESGKMTAFEEDLRIPLIIRGPNVPQGTVDLMSANVDYAPTIADLAEVQVPDFVDGRSLLPFLKGESPTLWRQVVLLEHKQEKAGENVILNQENKLLEPPDPFDLQMSPQANKRSKDPKITAFNGLRSADGYTYVQYSNGDRELYDNATDPLQLNNAYNTAPDELKTKFANWLSALVTTGGETLRQAEVAPPQ
jgi:N-acetylglucosamine-6-sulfatase